MPAVFSIDAKLGVIFSKATGVFSRVEALDHIGRLFRQPDFRPEFNQLLDFREITKLELSGGDIRDLAARTIFSPRSKRAFVVSSDEQFGLSRMFGTHRALAGE